MRWVGQHMGYGSSDLAHVWPASGSAFSPSLLVAYEIFSLMHVGLGH
jgi:hypothetical protein